VWSVHSDLLELQVSCVEDPAFQGRSWNLTQIPRRLWFVVGLEVRASDLIDIQSGRQGTSDV
jgi:hypothetical protein